MPFKKIFDPKEKKRPMRVAGFMSGTGSNLLKIIEYQKKFEREKGQNPYDVVFVFSDRTDGKSSGEQIAHMAGIPYFSCDIRRFYEIRNQRRTVSTSEGMAVRKEFDQVALKLISAFDVDIIALAGYMSYITIPKCVNVHPADLSITSNNGQRKYVGDDAVYDAIASGETELRSSTIMTDKGIDSGPLLMISKPVPVKLPSNLKKLKENPAELRKTADIHQDQLKEKGDWSIFPLTLRYIAEGRYAFDDKEQLYFDGKRIPEGLRL